MLVIPAERQYLKRYLVIVADLFYIHHSHVARSHLRAISHVNGPRDVVTLKLRIIVTQMTRIVPNAPS